MLRGLQERFIRTADQLAEAETLLAEVGGTAAPANSPPTSSHLITAIRTCIEDGGDSGAMVTIISTQRRLLTRLDQWIASQLTRRDTLETQLRQRCSDLEVELAKASTDVSFLICAD